jgi:hypothetical protein
MIYIVINGPQILAATLVGLAFGYAYYRFLGRIGADVAFAPRGTPWITAAVAFVAEYWLASILAGALILAPPEQGPWVMAVGTAVVIWIGFVVPALVVTGRVRQTPRRQTLIDCGHWLGVMLLHVIVLQSLGLTPPPGAPGT